MYIAPLGGEDARVAAAVDGAVGRSLAQLGPGVCFAACQEAFDSLEGFLEQGDWPKASSGFIEVDLTGDTQGWVE
jgi:hypothetical protein